MRKERFFEMANQPNVNKRHITVRVNIETCRAVEKKYRQDTDTNATPAFVRALEDAVRDVELTPEDYKLIADEAFANAQRVKKGR